MTFHWRMFIYLPILCSSLSLSVLRTNCMGENRVYFWCFFGFLFSEQYFLCLNKINMYSGYEGLWYSSMHRSHNKRIWESQTQGNNTCTTAGKNSENTAEVHVAVMLICPGQSTAYFKLLSSDDGGKRCSHNHTEPHEMTSLTLHWGQAAPVPASMKTGNIAKTRMALFVIYQRLKTIKSTL